jgi:hypothetical protein
MSLKSWTVFRINMYKNKRRQKLKKGRKGIVMMMLHNSQLSLQNTGNIVILHIEIPIRIRKVYFRMVYETKKNIQNIRNFEYTKCHKHPTGSSEGVGVEGWTVVPPPPPISVLKFLCCV